jgi:hypothetical protein
MKARVTYPGLVLALLALGWVLATAAQQRAKPPDPLAPVREAMRAGKYEEAEKLLRAAMADARRTEPPGGNGPDRRSRGRARPRRGTDEKGCEPRPRLIIVRW